MRIIFGQTTLSTRRRGYHHVTSSMLAWNGVTWLVGRSICRSSRRTSSTRNIFRPGEEQASVWVGCRQSTVPHGCTVWDCVCASVTDQPARNNIHSSIRRIAMTRVALKGELGRSERLPMEFEAVDAECLTRILRNRYPEVTIDKLDIVEFIPGHTTKARIAVSYGPGSEAGLPESLCLKANWSGNNMSSDACVNEADRKSTRLNSSH